MTPLLPSEITHEELRLEAIPRSVITQHFIPDPNIFPIPQDSNDISEWGESSDERGLAIASKYPIHNVYVGDQVFLIKPEDSLAYSSATVGIRKGWLNPDIASVIDTIIEIKTIPTIIIEIEDFHIEKKLYDSVYLLCENAREEYFELGMESEFYKALTQLIKQYDNIIIKVIHHLIENLKIDDYVAAEALKIFGAINNDTSYRFRLITLEKYLQHESIIIRDAAGLGIASLDDPSALPSIDRAIVREENPGIRECLVLVKNQLEHTSK